MIKEVAIMFMIYGLIGWIWETPYVSFKTKRFVNRGFLRGPFIPIYGFAATTMMLSLNWFSQRVAMSSLWHYVLALVFTGLIASLWEYATSYLMEVAFSARWWDYSYYKFHLHGRIALVPSIFWGLGGFFLWYVVNPVLVHSFEKAFKEYADIVILVFYTLLMIDALITLSELIQFRRILTKLHTSSEKVWNVLALKLDQVEETIESYMDLERLKEAREFINFARQKTKHIVGESEKKIEEFTGIVEKLERLDRFYQKYPHAITKKLPYIYYSIKKKITDREDRDH